MPRCLNIAAFLLVLVGLGCETTKKVGTPLDRSREYYEDGDMDDAFVLASEAASSSDAATAQRGQLVAGLSAFASDQRIYALAGAAVPVPGAVLRPGTLAVDLMYGAAAAPFMAWARQHGATARDGLGMLVEQAAEAFYLWRGVMPATAPVLAALRAEVDASA
jgi:hypothetical protein